jgi:septum formation protein
VISAVSLLSAGREAQAVSRSEVTFAELSDGDIDGYVATGEPMGKAGAYAIQGVAQIFIAHLSGSFSGVMGLPLYETAELLRQFGLPAHAGPRAGAVR